MRISDWSSDVCSSDLHLRVPPFFVLIIEWGDFMDASTKKKLLAAAAGLSVMTASPAAGQEPVAPVKIGVMDLEVKGLAFSDSNTMIEYQDRKSTRLKSSH